MLLDMIYLDKHGDDDRFLNTWTYYRLTSVTGLGNPEGTLGSSVEACRVTWPKLEDIQPPIDSIGVTGYKLAYPTVNTALLKQWNIERERSIFIGMRVREKE
jgi:hypothetical protein